MNFDERWQTGVEIEREKKRYETWLAIELIDSIMKRISTNRKKYLRKSERRGEGGALSFYRLIDRFAIRLNTRVETMLDNSRGLLIDAVTSATVCNPKCCRGHAVATCARRWQDHQLGELIAQQKYAGDGNRRHVANRGHVRTECHFGYCEIRQGEGRAGVVMMKTCEKKMRWGRAGVRVIRELSL